jgi:hypothetical protein
MFIFIHNLIAGHLSDSILLKIVHRILSFKLFLRSVEFHLALLVLVESHLLRRRRLYRSCFRRNLALGTPRILYQLVTWHHLIPLHRVIVFTIHDMAKVLSDSNVLSLNILLRYFVWALIFLRFDDTFALAAKFTLLLFDPLSHIFVPYHFQLMLKMRSIYFFISFLNDVIGQFNILQLPIL